MADDQGMKLYWAPKTRSLRALWVIEEVGRPYERELVDIHAGEQRTQAFRAINPMMKVPALSDGEARLAESAAICAYVAEGAPESGLAPAVGDPLRGRYLHWLFFSAACVEAALMQKFAGFEMNESSAGWGSFERVFAVIEQALTPGPWLLGERFSAADVMMGSDLRFAVEVFKIVPPRPVFADYLARCAERPALKRAMAIEEAGV